MHTSADFPIVLAAGRRRAFTANTIFRDSTWRKHDQQGALRFSPHDAEQLGLSDGALAQITTTRGTAQAVVEIDDRLQAGHAALPNGFGLDLPTEDGGTERIGVALNTLTWRDPIAGTPGTNTSPPASNRFPPDEHPTARGSGTAAAPRMENPRGHHRPQRHDRPAALRGWAQTGAPSDVTPSATCSA
ncbi:molybdopterin dinucleotide binding domain-containing protein [Streptomyces sp. NPDC088921]|uniref:molybdopterin dinucleotide binding domain-containing protein n=1 Tax=unclassified Streptomyces TaxID=2593676 RepID=UPI0034243827